MSQRYRKEDIPLVSRLPLGKWRKVKEATKEFGFSYRMIRRWILRGRINAYRDRRRKGHSILINFEEIRNENEIRENDYEERKSKEREKLRKRIIKGVSLNHSLVIREVKKSLDERYGSLIKVIIGGTEESLNSALLISNTMSSKKRYSDFKVLYGDGVLFGEVGVFDMQRFFEVYRGKSVLWISKFSYWRREVLYFDGINRGFFTDLSIFDAISYFIKFIDNN